MDAFAAPEWREALTAGSATLTALSVVPYVIAIQRGLLRPQRTSWFVFAVLSSVAAATQFAAGGGSGAWLCLGSALGFGTVFVLSIHVGVGGRQPSDLVAISLTAVSIVVWFGTGRPLLGTLAVVVAELAAVALTVRKELASPGTERHETWAIDATAGVLALAAVPSLAVAHVLYPLHHTLVNAWVVATVAHTRRRHGVGVPMATAPWPRPTGVPYAPPGGSA